MACWLRSFVQPTESPAFHRLPGHELDLEVHSTLFSEEQSSSSVAFGDDSCSRSSARSPPE